MKFWDQGRLDDRTKNLTEQSYTPDVKTRANEKSVSQI